MREPLVPPLAAIATGILVSRFAPFETRELLISIAAFLTLAILSLRRRNRMLAGACCLPGLVCAGALVAVVNRPGPPPELDAEGPVILTGCVVEPPVLSGDRGRFILELEPGARAQVSMYLREGDTPPKLDYGQRIELDAKVRSPHNFGNPGAFDYVRYLARKNIFWLASTSGASAIRILPGSCGSRFQRAVAGMRTAALDRIEALYSGNPYDTGMMQAILIGESFKLQKVWVEQFRSTGTFHALVISGTHVAVLAAFFFFLLRACFVPQGAARAITVLAAWLYALVTGWQAPVVRSAAGFTLFMVGSYFYRERRIMNLLAAVVIGFLVLDPEQMFEPSFQLSFLAVGFIAAFALPLLERTSVPLARGLRDLDDTGRDPHLAPRVAQFRVETRLLIEAVRLSTRLPARAAALLLTLPARALFHLYELVLISAVVQAGLALPMVIYFHRVGFSGLSANVIVVPLLGLVVPVGFAAVFTGWAWMAKAAGALLALSQTVVNWHAALEPNWRIPTPPLWLAVALSAALIAVGVSRGRWWRAAAMASALALLVVLVWHPFPAAVAKHTLELTAIDVGQGDSLLLAFPEGKLMLVDGGGIPSFGRASESRLDIGEDVVAPYLWSRSIRRVDVVAATHVHEDHCGGLRAILEDFHVKELWTGATPDSPEWRELRETAVRNGVRIIALRGGRQFRYGGAAVRVLAPSPDYATSDTPRNDDSLVFRVTYGRHSFVMTGDSQRTTERELLDANLVEHADVLKVAHHGSRTSSSPEFLDALRPAFALISDGNGNSYGYPNRDVLERMNERRIAVLRTDNDGAISVQSDGKRLSVNTMRWSGSPNALYSVF